MSATAVSAVPELIDDGDNGLLTPPGDSARLAQSIERLIRDPGLRQRLGRAGADLIRRDFAMDRGIDRLAEKFGLAT